MKPIINSSKEDRQILLICCIVALISIPGNPILQYAWGFIVGFSRGFIVGFSQ
jgi:hypothetical protein